MITNRHAPKLAAVLMALAVLACIAASGLSGTFAIDSGVTMEYESKLFDTSEVLEVNILMDEADWEAMLDSAMSEEYVTCDVEIAGQTFYRVGIRPKGNTSLSSIANDPNTDRYSFKLEFDQYVEGQTCFGLDKLILNNNYADATNMKEALIYDLFAHVGADASLYNYARVSVNGEYWGVYLALEAVEDSFLLRNYGAQDGELYKPDSMNMGGGGGRGGFDKGDFSAMQPPSSESAKGTGASADNETGESGRTFDRKNFNPGDFSAEGFNAGDFTPGDFNAEDFDASGIRDQLADFMGGGFGGMGGGGANLNYSDDSLDSYSTIWEGEVTNTGDKDHKRVVTALKAIDQGADLETYMDTANLVKYAAVHIFSENSDSLSGSMAHNYYLYESDGRLNLLPWDYNLALGGMGMGSSADGESWGGATGTVNGPIDDAWSGTRFFDTLMADEEYHAAYYEAMGQVVEYIQNGGFEAFYTRTRALIDELVASDPNAFYTYEEYETALATLYEVVTLRGQSIAGQLDGSIPSTAAGQRSSDALIDASHLNLSIMGTMSMGGGSSADGESRGFGPSDDRSSWGQRGETEGEAEGKSDAQSTPATPVATPMAAAGMPSGGMRPAQGQMPEGFDPSQFGGQMPEGMDPSQFGGQMPEGMDPSQFGGQMPEGFDPSQFDGQMPEGFDPSQFGGQMPAQTGAVSGGDPSGDAQSGGSPSDGGQTGIRPSQGDFGQVYAGGSGGSGTLLLYGVSAAVMLAALVFAWVYRRRPGGRR